MNPLLQLINQNISAGVDQLVHDDVSWLFNHDWSCVIDLSNTQNVTLFDFYNGCTISWHNNQILVMENDVCCLSTPSINLPKDGKVILSISLTEGFIRVLNAIGTNGTWKGVGLRDKNSRMIYVNTERVKEIEGGAETFDRQECLKNMSGLELWLVPHKDCYVISGTNIVSTIQSQTANNIVFNQNAKNKLPKIISEDLSLFFEPEQCLLYQGKEFNWLFNHEHDMILFLAIEPYEYVSPFQTQTILKFIQDKNEYSLMYTRTQEELGNYKNREFTYRFFIKHQYINGSTYETLNFVDLFTTQWIYKNERPGPAIYFLITQQIKDNHIKIQNYNYNKKWFIFEELNQNISLNSIDEPTELQLGGNYHGKIKELFIFNRKLTSENVFQDQSVKWIMAYLKYKYAIEEKLIDLKNDNINLHDGKLR